MRVLLIQNPHAFNLLDIFIFLMTCVLNSVHELYEPIKNVIIVPNISDVGWIIPGTDFFQICTFISMNNKVKSKLQSNGTSCPAALLRLCLLSQHLKMSFPFQTEERV